jgi:hypothetical protein
MEAGDITQHAITVPPGLSQAARPDEQDQSDKSDRADQIELNGDRT